MFKTVVLQFPKEKSYEINLVASGSENYSFHLLWMPFPDSPIKGSRSHTKDHKLSSHKTADSQYDRKGLSIPCILSGTVIIKFYGKNKQKPVACSQ